MQVLSSVLAAIAVDVHKVMGDISKSWLSILNIIEGTANLYREGVVWDPLARYQK